MSDDGRWSLTVIAMLGAVFSPAYRRARLAGPADPLDHAAMNVALRGPKSGFCLTERPRWSVRRSADELILGGSRVQVGADAVTLDLDEEQAPRLPLIGARRVRARVALEPTLRTEAPLRLDRRGLHRWHPYAPACRARVELPDLGVRFTGSGYCDANWGDEGLEDGFERWTWSRTVGGEGTWLTYDAVTRDGEERRFARRIDRDGTLEELDAETKLARAPLPATRWGLARTVLADPGTAARVVRDLEDTPFYSRSLVETTLGGARRESVHEALSLDRYVSPAVQFMLPYRMLATP